MEDLLVYAQLAQLFISIFLIPLAVGVYKTALIAVSFKIDIEKVKQEMQHIKEKGCNLCPT